jgi:4-coumarate--CoA ligase
VPRAYVVLRQPRIISEDDMKNFISRKLAAYKHLRGGVKFIDELPKNAIGKMLRRELRDPAIAEQGGVKAKL